MEKIKIKLQNVLFYKQFFNLIQNTDFRSWEHVKTRNVPSVLHRLFIPQKLFVQI